MCACLPYERINNFKPASATSSGVTPIESKTEHT